MADEVDDLGGAWKALSDPTRRGILDLLRGGSANTGTICETFPDLGRHAVIRHVKVLESAGFVRVEASGRERINHLNTVPLQQIYERWMRPYESRWASGMLRLGEVARTYEEPTTKENTMSEPAVRVVKIHLEDHVDANIANVWKALTEREARWWTFSHGVGPGVSLDATVGGLFFDDLGDGNGYTYAVVRGVHAEKELIMDGTFGLPGALQGQVKVTLDSTGESRTTVTIEHEVIGAIAEGAEAGHTKGWSELLANLATNAKEI